MTDKLLPHAMEQSPVTPRYNLPNGYYVALGENGGWYLGFPNRLGAQFMGFGHEDARAFAADMNRPEGGQWQATDQVRTLETHKAQLMAFCKHFIRSGAWDVEEPDGGDIQDTAVKYGLLKEVRATDENRDQWQDMADLIENGDTFYVFHGPLAAPAESKTPQAANDNWCPISEAPKDGTFILACTPAGTVLRMQWCADQYWRTHVDHPHHWNPTHYQPLPPPPAANANATTESKANDA